MEVWNVDGKMRLPINPFTIAERLGIDVKRAPLEDGLAGFIIREVGEGAEIYINESDSKVRQRFTLAHELGHYVRHQDSERIAYVDHRAELASSGTNPSEIWCNRFAAELLMPAAVVKKYWADGYAIDELRRKFGVSEAAVNFRIANLGLT